jgi:hypothetical protein
MGWGTFVAGRVLGPRRRRGVTQSDIRTADFLNSIINKRINTTIGLSGIALEKEVLREIRRLKSEGEDGDIDAIREVVQNRFKTYHRLGPKLELEIIRISQIKALAGEEVNYGQIEREILDTPNKKFSKQKVISGEKVGSEKIEQDVFDTPNKKLPKSSIPEKNTMFSKILLPQEKIYTSANFTAITSSRLLKVSLMGKMRNSVLLEDIVDFTTTRKKFATAGPLLVETKNGKLHNFGPLRDGEYLEFQRVLAMITSRSVTELAESEDKPKIKIKKTSKIFRA